MVFVFGVSDCEVKVMAGSDIEDKWNPTTSYRSSCRQLHLPQTNIISLLHHRHTTSIHLDLEAQSHCYPNHSTHKHSLSTDRARVKVPYR